MGTTLADLLVGENTLELLRKDLLLVLGVQVLIDLVDNLGEELKGILLLPHVDRLAPQLEALPKLVRDEVLQFRLKQVTEDSLQLIEDGFLFLLLDLDTE